MNTPIMGYKVTNSEMECRNFKFELNKRHKIKGNLQICSNGFHFCKRANDCFNYYSFDSSNRVFEVVAYGNTIVDGDKSCTDEIELTRELTWLEVLGLVNIGQNNTGNSNSGYRNSGGWNSGGWNSGGWNSGDRNSGDSNSGYRNSGGWNSGGWNSGNRNSGDRNSGDSNSGYRNSGDSNSGYRNSGGWNSGGWNSGNRNSGDSNSGYRNSGAFCTDNNPKIKLFDFDTDMTVREWEDSEAVRIMYDYLSYNVWVRESEVTDADKEKYPSYKTTGGYLKSISHKEGWGNMWHNLTDDKKKVFTSLPNFNADKFFEITGIRV